MLTNVTDSLQRGMRSFGQFTAGQKAVTIAAILGIVFGGFFFSQWASKPTMAPLFTGLAGSDASAIVDKLSVSGTPYQLADGGSTIMVPQAQVADTRIAMSGQGLPAGDASGYALLDKQGITASQFQQQIAARRALEGELVKTIEVMDGIDTAVVHLAIPEKDVFSKQADKATASVLLGTGVGDGLTPQQVQAVTNIVASSVEGLAPEDVSIADAKGNVLSGSTVGGSAGAADTRSQETQAYEGRVSASLENMLSQVVGPGHAVVQLTADLDFDKTDTTTETTTGNPTSPPVSRSSSSEKWTGGGPAVGGVLWPDNINVPAGSNSGTGNYQKAAETVNNAMTKVVEQRTSAPGKVNKLNVAVLLDTKTAGTVNVAQVQALVSSAVGIDVKRGDQVQVARMPFDTSAAKSAATELANAKKADATAARNTLLKNGGLGLLVGAVLLLALIKGRKRKGSGALTSDERLQIEQLQRALELQSAARTELESAPGAMAALEPAPLNPKAELAALARTEIGELVQSQPEEVAQLLRGWLADRRS